MNDERSIAEDIAAAAVPPASEGPPMTELERIRHSAAHVLATAILRLWPEAQFAAGPPVENRLLLRCRTAASHLARGL